MMNRRGMALMIALVSAARGGLAQDAARSRIEREASAQAAQADRLFKAGRLEAALKLYRAEADSRKALGDARYEAYAHRGIGCCLVGLKDDESAIGAFRAAMAIDDGRDDPGFAGYDGLLIAQAQLRLSRSKEAVETLTKALPRLGQAVDRDHECDARACLAQALVALDAPAKAAPEAARALALARELDDSPRLANAWLALGLADRDLGRLGPASMRLQDARDAYRDQSRDADYGLVTGLLADVSRRLGRDNLAATFFDEAAAVHAKLGDAPWPRPTTASTSLPCGSIWATPRRRRARPNAPATASSRRTRGRRPSTRWSSWPRPRRGSRRRMPLRPRPRRSATPSCCSVQRPPRRPGRSRPPALLLGRPRRAPRPRGRRVVAPRRGRQARRFGRPPRPPRGRRGGQGTTRGETSRRPVGDRWERRTRPAGHPGRRRGAG